MHTSRPSNLKKKIAKNKFNISAMFRYPSISEHFCIPAILTLDSFDLYKAKLKPQERLFLSNYSSIGNPNLKQHDIRHSLQQYLISGQQAACVCIYRSVCVCVFVCTQYACVCKREREIEILQGVREEALGSGVLGFSTKLKPKVYGQPIYSYLLGSCQKDRGFKQRMNVISNQCI